MDMEVTAWMSLYHAMNAEEDRRPFSRATLRRIAAFARPHRRLLIAFLLLSVVRRSSRWRRRCSPAGSSTPSWKAATLTS